MGWFSNKKKESSAEREGLWTKCPKCAAHVYKNEWADSLRVCPECNYHDRLTCDERIKLLIDEGTFQEHYQAVVPIDHLKFVDGKGSYVAKVEADTAKTGLAEAIKTGRGKINGKDVVIGVMDFRFVGGSLSSGVGEKIFLAATLALKRKLPCIIVSASGGARMQEGILSLMQMAKTCAAISKLDKANIPYISILSNPTFGGVSASYAMVGDVNISEPGALIGFAGRRVIEQTIKQKLPPDFQTAEYLLEHGFLDMIVTRNKMKDTVSRILAYRKSR